MIQILCFVSMNWRNTGLVASHNTQKEILTPKNITQAVVSQKKHRQNDIHKLIGAKKIFHFQIHALNIISSPFIRLS